MSDSEQTNVQGRTSPDIDPGHDSPMITSPNHQQNQPPQAEPTQTTSTKTPETPIHPKKTILIRCSAPVPEGRNMDQHIPGIVSPTIDAVASVSVVQETVAAPQDPTKGQTTPQEPTPGASEDPQSTDGPQPFGAHIQTTKLLHQTYVPPYAEIQQGGVTGADLTQRMSDVDYDMETGRPTAMEIGKSNHLLYSTSLCKFPEFIDTRLDFETYAKNMNIEANVRHYFDYLLNLLPSVLH